MPAIEGAIYDAAITEVVRWTLDTKAVKTEMGGAWYDARCRQSLVTTIKTTARAAVAVQIAAEGGRDMERLTRRNILGAAGALAGGSALAGAAVAMPASEAVAASGADAELFALLDEEDRLWTMISRLQDEASRRKQAISVGRVEFGQSEPPRDCRRPQLLRGRGHDEQDDEQVFA